MIRSIVVPLDGSRFAETSIPNGEPPTDFSIRDGVPAESLVSGIREAAAELVVMATHGRGSVAPPVPVRALLVPIGPERDPEFMITALAAFACLTQTHVTLLNVVSATEPRGVAQKRLDRLADELRTRGIHAAARVIVGPDIAAAIVAELAHGSADLLVVAPRRAEASGWSPEDGITESLTRNAAKPVLILPTAAVRAHA